LYVLQEVLTVDLPVILNGRKQLDRLVLELDTAKARLERAKEEEQSASAGLLPLLKRIPPNSKKNFQLSFG
jgi:hypothetical protein